MRIIFSSRAASQVFQAFFFYLSCKSQMKSQCGYKLRINWNWRLTRVTWIRLNLFAPKVRISEMRTEWNFFRAFYALICGTPLPTMQCVANDWISTEKNERAKKKSTLSSWTDTHLSVDVTQRKPLSWFMTHWTIQTKLNVTK